MSPKGWRLSGRRTKPNGLIGEFCQPRPSTLIMEAPEERARAVVVLRRDDRDVLLGPVYGPERCDLGFVEGLLRVQLTARRFGWSIRLTEVRPDLLELVELVGLSTDLVD